MNLSHNTYGKADVPFLKVFRDGSRHRMRELAVSVRVEGEAFAANYTDADNASCVPTETITNNVYRVAAERFEDGPIEVFAQDLAHELLARYSVMQQVQVQVVETGWNRIADHDHAFRQAGGATHYALAEGGREELRTSAGFEGLSLLKTTGSGFSGFHVCDRTVLPETEDRILATTVQADWAYHGTPDYDAVRETVLERLLAVFRQEHSPSVQRTLYRVGEEVLAAVPEIAALTLALPNEHYFPVDLERIGGTGDGTLFYPSKRPYGDIEATVTRDS